MAASATTPKLYRGIRGDEGFYIYVNGEPLLHVVLHSPTGFSWGYHGSGPADAALSILADHFGEQPSRRELDRGLCRCQALYQYFKSDVLARFPMEHDWDLTTAEIQAFLDRHRNILADADERIQLVTAIEQDTQAEREGTC